jgi:hypothetical protein
MQARLIYRGKQFPREFEQMSMRQNRATELMQEWFSQ